MGEAFGHQGLSKLTKFAGGVAAIAGAIHMGTRALDAYLQTIHKVSEAASGGVLSARGFANLQPTELMSVRVQEMSRLMVRHGVKQFDQGFDAAQSFQSMYGSYAAGKAATKTVFTAAEYGVPLELGKEVEAMGGGLGMPPGHFLRMTGIAGEESGRGVKEVAKAAQSLLFWPDKVQGAAAATGLAELFGDELKTYLKAAGVGLAPTGGLAGKFEELGVADADYVTKLKALRAAEITTPVKLYEAGLTEIRQQAAISGAIEKLDKIVATVPILEAKNVPGFFGEAIKRMQTGMPGMKEALELQRAKAGLKEATAFGPETAEYMTKQREQVEFVTGLRGLGHHTLAEIIADEEGRFNKVGQVLVWSWRKRVEAWNAVVGAVSPVQSERYHSANEFYGAENEENMGVLATAIEELRAAIIEWGVERAADRLMPTPSE